MTRYVITTWPDDTGSAPKDSQWFACFGDYDEGKTTASGETEEAAVRDLLDNYDWEAEPPTTPPTPAAIRPMRDGDLPPIRDNLFGP